MSKRACANSCAAVERITSGWWASRLVLTLIITVSGSSGSFSQTPSASWPFSSWIGRSRPQDRVIGFVDWRFSAHGLIVDLKTTERLPSAIGASHGRQGAVYATAHGNFGMRFATAAKFMQAA